MLALDRTAETADVVVVRELTIDAPDIVFDKGEDGSNIEAIQQNVNEYIKAIPAERSRRGREGRRRPHALHHRVAADPRRQDPADRARDRVVDLPPVSLRDLGKSQGGMTGAEIASIVLKQMTDATVSPRQPALAEEGKEQLKEEVKGRRRPGRD